MLKEDLDNLHQMLVKSYLKMLSAGVEDPRLLKEIRELLKDNDITGDISDIIDRVDEAIVDLPEDWALEG